MMLNSDNRRPALMYLDRAETLEPELPLSARRFGQVRNVNCSIGNLSHPKRK